MSRESSSLTADSEGTVDLSGSVREEEGGLRAWHVAGLLLVVAVFGLGLYGLWPVITGEAGDEAAREDVEAPSSEAQVDVVVAQEMDFPLRTEASGHLVPWRQATLRAEASGQVEERAVEEGDYVAAGGLLAQLENREERIALEEGRAELLTAEAEYQANYGSQASESLANRPANGGSSAAATDSSQLSAVELRRPPPVASPRHDRPSSGPASSWNGPALRADLEGAPQMDVRVVVDGADQLDVETLIDRPLVLAGSTQVKLKNAADYRVETVPSRIVREDQQYKRYVEVDYRGPHRMGSEFLDEALDGFSTPPGYRLEREQTAFFTAETERAFGWVILGTIVLVFLATAAVFESWRQPGVVLLSLPTGLVGVAAAFLLMGDLAFADGAFIGSVLLVGLAANDSILLVDRYRYLRQARPLGAVGPRLRPMWTTTLSTCVAMLPLLVFPQEGEFWTGMAVTVTGGLLAATLLAPLATVALVSCIDQ